MKYFFGKKFTIQVHHLSFRCNFTEERSSHFGICLPESFYKNLGEAEFLYNRIGKNRDQ
jgi:hypothetical protein